ncbi:MAG TPA: DNA translocase FtsK 4TM domain-containing protein [Candidatus Deferrimicrobium sp.]|nr:DNA translocase FtsK 4TM domain-containing protein [Candidatus Deferrimicrobium sp.]
MAKGRKRVSTAQRRKQIFGVVLILIAAFVFVSLAWHYRIDDQRLSGQLDGHLSPFEIAYHNQAGLAGAYLSLALTLLLGWLSYFIPFVLLEVALRLLLSNKTSLVKANVACLFLAGLVGTIVYNIHLLNVPHLTSAADVAGGYVTGELTAVSIKLIGETGSYILLSGLFLALLIVYPWITPLLKGRLPTPSLRKVKKAAHLATRLYRSVVRRRTSNESEETEGVKESAGDLAPDASRAAATTGADQEFVKELDDAVSRTTEKRKAVLVKPPQPVQLKSMAYTYPGIDLLSAPPSSGEMVAAEELVATARMLKETLEVFGVTIDGPIERYPGPVITRYEFKPAAGIKVNQIVNLSDDLALALKAKRIRIIAPIPGKAAVGIEIPNRQAQMVVLRDILTSEAFLRGEMRLPLALGKTTAGKSYVVDLTKLPHLLIAGATGSGKSVCLNCLITSLLYRLHPHQVRFILIDPKMLELTAYKGLPHLGRPVVTSPRRAEKVLAEVVAEMEGRYRKLAEASVRNIEDFNRKQADTEKQIPYIVICVDELADLLMASATTRTELLITRLAQMSRAVGIHLILATQRPSVDVITGLIKANFPARVAFQVSSKVDSRTIIDANGAEKLLGSGDMLFLHPGQPEAMRLHGAYVSGSETEAVVKFIADQGLPMLAMEGISQAEGETSEAQVDFGDPLFQEACEVVIQHKQGSVSLLQRRLGIGYQRAARLIDKLEQAGIVSPFDGSKAREVIVDKAYLDTLFAGSRMTSGSDAPTT